jgi:hypothetical protein
VDRSTTSVICDQIGVLTFFYSSKDYPAALRRVVVKDETGKRITFLTNNFAFKPELIADLYRQRWQVELFFKWIKQHLRIKAFLGTSENAVKTQIWIAVCTYVLIAIAKKRLHLDHHSLYEILQILSLTMFETNPNKSTTYTTLNKFRSEFRDPTARSPLKNVGTLLIRHHLSSLSIFATKGISVRWAITSFTKVNNDTSVRPTITLNADPRSLKVTVRSVRASSGLPRMIC